MKYASQLEQAIDENVASAFFEHLRLWRKKRQADLPQQIDDNSQNRPNAHQNSMRWRTKSASVTTMLSEGTNDPTAMPAVTVAEYVGDAKVGGLLLEAR